MNDNDSSSLQQNKKNKISYLPTNYFTIKVIKYHFYIIQQKQRTFREQHLESENMAKVDKFTVAFLSHECILYIPIFNTQLYFYFLNL